jgi:hypothetical protein
MTDAANAREKAMCPWLSGLLSGDVLVQKTTAAPSEVERPAMSESVKGNTQSLSSGSFVESTILATIGSKESGSINSNETEVLAVPW